MSKHGIVAVLLFLLSVFPRIIPAQGVWTSYPDTLELRDMTLQGDYLWCATKGGIVRYDTRDLSKRVYTAVDGLPGETWSVTAGPDGTMWASAGGPAYSWTLCRFRDGRWEQHRTLETYPFPESATSHRGPWYIETSPSGNLWLGSMWGIDARDSLFTVPPLPVGNLMADEYLRYLKSDRNGAFWAGTLYSHHSYRHAAFFRYNGYEWENYFLWYNEWPGSTSPVAAGRGGEVWVYDYHEVFGGDMEERLVRFDGQETVFFPYSETGMSGRATCGSFGPAGTVWFGTDAGEVYVFDGTTWRGYTPDLDYLFESAVKAIETAPNGVVWVGTDRGVSRFVPEFLSAGEIAARPAAVRIEGNVPNPFNPSTAISFTLPRAARVELAVYSITGQKVRTLLSGPLGAGTHSAVWDGKDDSGKAVSSGVYISRLQAGKQTTGHKMLLMR